jgi:hypothetical protein
LNELIDALRTQLSNQLVSGAIAPGLVGVAKQLHDDIHEFFTRREWYAQMGIPWRRGYLFLARPAPAKPAWPLRWRMNCA